VGVPEQGRRRRRDLRMGPTGCGAGSWSLFGPGDVLEARITLPFVPGARSRFDRGLRYSRKEDEEVFPTAAR